MDDPMNLADWALVAVVVVPALVAYLAACFVSLRRPKKPVDNRCPGLSDMNCRRHFEE